MTITVRSETEQKETAEERDGALDDIAADCGKGITLLETLRDDDGGAGEANFVTLLETWAGSQ